MSTLGVNFSYKIIELENKKKVKLKLIDTAGQEKFRSIAKSYYKNADAVLFVFALNDLDSFNHINDWVISFQENNGEKVLKYLVGNKYDVEIKTVDQQLIDGFTKEKNYEQDLHLTRLLNIRPRITITEPYIPYFMHSGGWQREKKRQEEDKVEKVNIIYYTKIFEANKKHSRYSRYEVEPKQIYPAFRRFSRYKLSDILNMIRIRKDNIRHENKIAEIKSDYDRVDMRKEAYKQKLYLSNLLKRPKSIPYAPQLKFKSIEQVNNIRLRSQILKNQKQVKKLENGTL